MQKRTRVLTERANKRAFVVDQSHSFIVGATVRMVAWAYWSEETIFCTNGVINM